MLAPASADARNPDPLPCHECQQTMREEQHERGIEWRCINRDCAQCATPRETGRVLLFQSKASD